MPPPPAPNQLCQARHSDLQRSSDCWHHQLRPWFSAAPLGSTSIPSHPDLEPSPTIMNQSATFRGSSTQWRVQFQLNPLAPPGTKPLIFESSADCRTWAPYGIYGWYLGPAPEHYRCYLLYVSKTRAERTAKTVQFFRTNVWCQKPPLSTQLLSQSVTWRGPSPIHPLPPCFPSSATPGSKLLLTLPKYSRAPSQSLHPPSLFHRILQS